MPHYKTVFDRPSAPGRQPDALELQAHEWVRRMTSGSARPADAQALARWCAASDAHAQAFRTAHRLWREMRPAAALAGAFDPELAALRAMPGRAQRMSRRAFLGGALAATAAAATGVALLDPSLDWLPGPASWQADYRTATGEQRRLALASDVTLDMNTRSSVALRDVRGETVGIELLDGEIAVDAMRRDRAFSVMAAGGRTDAQGARFELRHLDGAVCVTCIEGMVRVALAGNEVAFGAGRQLRYDRRAMQPVRSVNPADVSAWRSGILSFRQTALAHVVAEINRYRPGRVVLLGKAMDGKPVSGRFNIRELDKAIAQIQRLFRLEATVLPGGIVLLG